MIVNYNTLRRVPVELRTELMEHQIKFALDYFDITFNGRPINELEKYVS